jgi:hypothetical protein
MHGFSQILVISSVYDFLVRGPAALVVHYSMLDIFFQALKLCALETGENSVSLDPSPFCCPCCGVRGLL